MSNVDVVALTGETSYSDAKPITKGSAYRISFRLESANREIVRERRYAVINAREADRNNALVRSGITKRAVDMVGSNLRLQSLPNWQALGLTEEWAQEFAQTWEGLFSLWGDDPRKLCDAARHSSFGSLMFEAARNCYGADGEVALIVRYDEARMRGYRGKFATFVEAVDPDRISNQNGDTDNDRLCQGRVLDQWGAYTGFYCERNHPSDPASGVRKWELVQRETKRGRPIGIHWFPKFRAGAQRAMPAIIGSLRDIRMLDTFDNKTLEAAVKQAFMAIVIKTDSTSAEALSKIQAAPTGESTGYTMDDRFALYEDFNAEGQAIPVMLPNDSIDISESSHAANDYDSFRFAFERKFASSLGLSYARFSNDYSKTSFASIRAEFIDSWRMTYSDRYQFTNSVASLIALAHLEEMIVRGIIKLPPGAPDFYENMTEYAQCEWRGPGMGWVDPVKDVNGADTRIAKGMSNPIAEAAAQGTDYFDNIDALARAQKYAEKKLGAKITYGNQPQQAADADAEDTPGTNNDPNAPPGGDASTGEPA